MRLYRQTVEDFRLYAGLELTDEQVDSLRSAAGQMSAKMVPIFLLIRIHIMKKTMVWHIPLLILLFKKSIKNLVSRIIYTVRLFTLPH